MIKSKIVNIDDIILVLEEKFPNELPQQLPPMEEIASKIGEQRVLYYLKSLSESLDRKPKNAKS
jgi:hypothetical protein